MAELNVQKAQNMAARSRVSVSAEAFGKYHKKEAYTPVVIQKQQATKDKYAKSQRLTVSV